MRRASSTATSSRRISSSARAATPSCSISASPRCTRAGAHDVTGRDHRLAGLTGAGHGARDRRLHGAGAGARRRGRCPRRPVLVRCGALRNGQPASAVPGPAPCGVRACAARRDDPPRSWNASSRNAWKRIARSAISMRPDSRRSRAPEARSESGNRRAPDVAPLRWSQRRWQLRCVSGRRGRDCRAGRRVYSRLRAATHRQGHDRSGRLHEHDRRPGVRRDAATGTRGAAAAVAVPQPHFRRTHPQNAGLDEPAGGCAIDPRHCAGVCVRTASAAVLEGSIASLGSQYVLGLRATNCTTATSSPTSRRRRGGKKMS